MRAHWILASLIALSIGGYVQPAIAKGPAPKSKDAAASEGTTAKGAKKPAEPEKSSAEEVKLEETPPPDTAEASTEAPGAKAEEKPAEGAEPGSDVDKEVNALSSPVEEKGTTYRFVGLRYRLVIVPKFMINLFGDGGETVVAHSFGPEFAIRKDNFEYNFALTYTPYTMDATAFKASSDPEDAWEVVESHIKVLYITADFLWSHDFTPEVALNYGVGAGFGLVFGSLVREQAYKDANGDYVPCAAPGDPNAAYCGNDNDHYDGYEEPSWANGGSKPVIFPWLALQTGLRYKPHRNFVGRLDLGFGLGQFFFGLGADYGL